MNVRRRIGIGLAVGAGAAALTYAGYATASWLRYGRREWPVGSPLQRYLPDPEVAERHETGIVAAADEVWDAVMSVNLLQSPFVRLIFNTRALLMGAGTAEKKTPGPFIEEVRKIGWGVLDEISQREMVFGAVCKPWEGNVVFQAIPAGEFATFDEPGFTKIVWNVRVEPYGDYTLFRTETLAATTDDESRRRFRFYWALASPGIRLIRHEMLRLVRTRAERRQIETQQASATSF